MKTLGIVIGLFAVVLALYPACGQAAAQEGFAIYLSEGAKDEPPAITAADIVSFDWAKQSFILKPEASKRIPKLAPAGLKFTARVGEDIVYKGTFVSTISSFSIPGPVIVVDVMSAKDNAYAITIDYPGSGFTKDKTDPRWNPIIRESLAKAGKLTVEKAAASDSKAQCDWLKQTFTQIRTIRQGTLKEEVLKLFREDYGLQAVTGPVRYVFRECECIKIDVTFTAAGTVTNLSRPYLEFPAYD